MGSCVVTEAQNITQIHKIASREVAYVTEDAQEQKPKEQPIHFSRLSQNYLKRQEQILLSRSKIYKRKMKSFDESQLYKQQPEIDREIFDEAILGNREDLYTVTDQDFRNQLFHQYIGAFIAQHPCDKRRQIKGTAVLIASDLILTNAHNFYLSEGDMQTTKQRFYPALNGTLQNYYQIQSFYYPEEFQVFLTPEYDFAIAKLKRSVSQVKNPNYLALGFGFNDINAELSLFGYPDKDNYKILKDGKRCAFQKGLSKKESLRSVERNEISYRIPTLPGHSGSPIIAGKSKNLIVGLHKGLARNKRGSKQKEDEQDIPQEYNIGRYVNVDMILRMQIWRQKCNAGRFRVIDVQTNRQIDLFSPLLQEMKGLFVAELKKHVKFKKIYQRNSQARQIQIQRLQTQNEQLESNISRKEKQFQNLRSILVSAYKDLQSSQNKLKQIDIQNQNLKSFMKLKDESLSKKAKKLEQLQLLNSEFQEKLVALKQDIQNTNPEEQLILTGNPSYLFLKRGIEELQVSLRTKSQIYKDLMQESHFQSSCISQLNSNYLIQWDPSSRYAQNFSISKKKLELIRDSTKYQIVSRTPFPKKKVSTVVFKMGKYGGKPSMQICFGILCENRKNEQNSGRHIGSVGYFTNKELKRGWINAQEQAVTKQEYNLYLPEEEQLEMTVDLKQYKLTFRNRKYEGGSVTIDLPEMYRKQRVYAFCNMYCLGDMIKVIC